MAMKSAPAFVDLAGTVIPWRVPVDSKLNPDSVLLSLALGADFGNIAPGR